MRPTNATALERLKAIGFKHVGQWRCEANRLRVHLADCAGARNILYALVVAGEVAYVGKSVNSVRDRMRGYCKAGATQSTNVRNNRSMLEALAAGKEVDLYVLPDNGLLHYGGFHVNLAAGLEDSLVRELRPAWNGKASKPEA